MPLSLGFTRPPLRKVFFFFFFLLLYESIEICDKKKEGQNEEKKFPFCSYFLTRRLDWKQHFFKGNPTITGPSHPVEFKKYPCRPVDFRGLGPRCTVVSY